MSSLRPTIIKDEDVFALTDKGNAETKGAAGTSLSARELQVLIHIDGKTSVEQIAKASPNLAASEIVEILKGFFGSRLITNATEPSSDGLESGFFTIDVPAGFFTSTPKDDSEADLGVSSLEQDGYYVRIARKPADKREVKEGQKFTILVVDDDPDLTKLLKTYLTFEGFIPRIASNRAEFLTALRQPPLPDLALLDVELPDVNGFDILAKMRQHPSLKTMPVVMLTAEATRQSVLKGLLGGADGYVTKPFEPEAVTSAVKAVLGLSGAADNKAEAKPK